MSANRKVILFISMSLDGYIAKPNDDLSFLSMVEKKDEDYGYDNFLASVDTVIVGRKTYDWVMNQVPEFPHAEKDTYVITKKPRTNNGKTIFYHGKLPALVQKLKSEVGKNIYCDGGAEIVNELLKNKLIDELIISIIPVLLGNGKRLFADGRQEQTLKLLQVETFETGLTKLHYKCEV